VGPDVVRQATDPVPVLALALAVAAPSEGQIEVLMSLTEGLRMGFHSGVGYTPRQSSFSAHVRHLNEGRFLQSIGEEGSLAPTWGQPGHMLTLAKGCHSGLTAAKMTPPMAPKMAARTKPSTQHTVETPITLPMIERPIHYSDGWTSLLMLTRLLIPSRPRAWPQR